VVEYECPALVNIQSQLKKLVDSNFYLNKSAKDAFRSYLHAYASHSSRSVFDVAKLELANVAKSFGFPTPPRVDITIGQSMHSKQASRGRRGYGKQPWQGQRQRRGVVPSC